MLNGSETTKRLRKRRKKGEKKRREETVAGRLTRFFPRFDTSDDARVCVRVCAREETEAFHFPFLFTISPPGYYDCRVFFFSFSALALLSKTYMCG